MAKPNDENQELEQGGFDFVLPKGDAAIRNALETELQSAKDDVKTASARLCYYYTKIMLIEQLLENGTVNSWNFSREFATKHEIHQQQFVAACNDVHAILDPAVASKVILLSNVDFVIKVANRMADKLGQPLEHDAELRTAYQLGLVDVFEFEFGPAISLVEQVGPYFKCDVTANFSRDDAELLADQFAALFIRFGRAHARACPNCSDEYAASVVLVRFMNTYNEIVRHGGVVDDFPNREMYFFILDGSADYTVANSDDHQLRGDQLRQAVKDWKITGQ